MYAGRQHGDRKSLTLEHPTYGVVCREEAESLSEEIQRRQRIIEEQLAELKQISARLSPEEQQILLQAVEEKDGEAQIKPEQV